MIDDEWSMMNDAISNMEKKNENTNDGWWMLNDAIWKIKKRMKTLMMNDE